MVPPNESSAASSSERSGSAGKVPPKTAKKTAPTPGTRATAGAGTGTGAGNGGETPQGWGRYLVVPRPPAWLGGSAGQIPPVEVSVLFNLLEEDPDVRVITHIGSTRSRGLGAISEPQPACPPVAVVEMPDERARSLAGNPQVLVEVDQPLCYPTANPIAPVVPMADPALALAFDEPSRVRLRVQGSDGAPLAGAHVWAVGATSPAHTVTDSAGRAVLSMPADTAATVRTLFVRPAAEYWSARIDNPRLRDNPQEESVVELRPLAETFEGFPDRPLVGWGRQAMRLDQLPPMLRGQGIRIALLDSGISAAHPDLKDAVRGGYDFITASGRVPDGDATGHATWCAGVIAAADNHTGVAGVATDAELHTCKLFPNGRVSHLLQALDWCVSNNIDVAQLNLACPKPSALTALKLMDIRQAGVVCIAPAGDDGATVAFPASLPTVLSVGAIGVTGTYPPGTLQAAHLGDHVLRTGWAGGPFAPTFTPAGPGIDLVGPGVAVLTTAPAGSYTAVDGTGPAAAHITGLAAILLAHHDQLRGSGGPQTRTPARVDALTAVLRSSCRPIPGDPQSRHTGAGLPDAPTALGQA